MVQYIRMGEGLRSIIRPQPLTQLSPLRVWCSPLPKGEGTTTTRQPVAEFALAPAWKVLKSVLRRRERTA
jgi:hypothetical protein